MSSSYHHGDLRRGLLDAAESLLERNGGPAALSLREVARAAGVSHNAPYRHFADREAMLAALAAEGFLRLAAALTEAGAGPTAAGRAYLRFARTNRALYRLMFGPGISKNAHPELAAAAAAAFGALRAAYGQSSASSGRDRHLTIRAWALVHGLAHLIVDGQLADDLAQHDHALLIEDVLAGNEPPP